MNDRETQYNITGMAEKQSGPKEMESSIYHAVPQMIPTKRNI
ncbi:hypothetical protein [Echinicola rosea]|nr:hypothetical protein [Echinicola rosea]